MTAIPLADARALNGVARRTAAVRLVLALLAASAVFTAVLVSRHPAVQTLVPLASRGDTIVVVDLSASISTDTYSQIGATLSTLARSGGRLGLIVFSDEAYVAFPQGTPAADLEPLARLFTIRPETQAGFAPTLPPNPWTASFSGGTRISSGLTLAHTLATGTPDRPTVVLVSDLSDDPRDLHRLGTVLLAYRRDRIPVRIVALDPAPADLALFRRALSPAPATVRAPAPDDAAQRQRTPTPWLLIACALLACAGLATAEGWAPTVNWGRA